jgi:hypothetical protein
MARRHFFCRYFKLHIPFEVTFPLHLPLGIKTILFGKGMNGNGQVPNTQRFAQALFYYMIGKVLTSACYHH